MTDSSRFAEYNYMEVFNHKTQKYEKFNKANHINATVIIDTERKIISFTDQGNKYDKEYTIENCTIGKTNITYDCIDITNDRKCTFVFSIDKSLTVIYGCEPVVYRVKTIK